jgi:hypothetical protein
LCNTTTPLLRVASELVDWWLRGSIIDVRVQGCLLWDFLWFPYSVIEDGDCIFKHSAFTWQYLKAKKKRGKFSQNLLLYFSLTRMWWHDHLKTNRRQKGNGNYYDFTRFIKVWHLELGRYTYSLGTLLYNTLFNDSFALSLIMTLK